MPAAKVTARSVSTNWADAVSSISLISALVFGFSVSTFSERIGDTETFLDQIFCALMGVTIGCSAVATCTLSLQYYFIKRLLDVNPTAIPQFLASTSLARDLVGHKLTWLSLVMYIGALAVLAMDKLSGESAIVAGVTFLASAITIVFMGSFLARQNKAAEKSSGVATTSMI